MRIFVAISRLKDKNNDRIIITLKEDKMDVPDDCWGEIAQYLDYNELCHLRLTCKDIARTLVPFLPEKKQKYRIRIQVLFNLLYFKGVVETDKRYRLAIPWKEKPPMPLAWYDIEHECTKFSTWRKIKSWLEWVFRNHRIYPQHTLLTKNRQSMHLGCLLLSYSEALQLLPPPPYTCIVETGETLLFNQLNRLFPKSFVDRSLHVNKNDTDMTEYAFKKCHV